MLIEPVTNTLEMGFSVNAQRMGMIRERSMALRVAVRVDEGRLELRSMTRQLVVLEVAFIRRAVLLPIIRQSQVRHERPEALILTKRAHLRRPYLTPLDAATAGPVQVAIQKPPRQLIRPVEIPNHRERIDEEHLNGVSVLAHQQPR